MHYTPRPEMGRPLPAAMTLALFLVCFVAGCCRFQPAFVPVREAVHRSELATTNRLELPLSDTNRQFLLAFLQSGRNPGVDRDATIVDPEADAHYGGLLSLLAAPGLSVTNLVAEETFRTTPLFQAWFPGRAVRQVVDAREEWPAVRQPYAFLDRWERNWWIFYSERKRLTHVLVTRALEHEKPR